MYCHRFNESASYCVFPHSKSAYSPGDYPPRLLLECHLSVSFTLSIWEVVNSLGDCASRQRFLSSLLYIFGRSVTVKFLIHTRLQIGIFSVPAGKWNLHPPIRTLWVAEGSLSEASGQKLLTHDLGLRLQLLRVLAYHCQRKITISETFFNRFLMIYWTHTNTPFMQYALGTTQAILLIRGNQLGD